MHKPSKPAPARDDHRAIVSVVSLINQGMSRVARAKPLILTVRLRLEVLKWHHLARAVAAGAKVGATVHGFLHIAHRRVRPGARNYFKQAVLNLLFELCFKVFSLSSRLYKLHSHLLRLEFEAVERLYLGESHG